MSHFAVLDTETTWSDEVMSLGFVIADEDGFEEVCGEYYIVDPWIFRFERASVPEGNEPVCFCLITFYERGIVLSSSCRICGA